MSQKVSITNPEGSFYELLVTAGAAITPVAVQPGQSLKFDLPVSVEQGTHVVIPAA